MKSVMITGANRGIGLLFARQYAAEGYRVHACCRDVAGAKALRSLADEADVNLHRMDVINPEQIRETAQALRHENLDILINNAGVYGPRGVGLEGVDYQAWLRVLEVNTLGPHRVTAAFWKHVARGSHKVIAHITSKMGSIADNTSGGSYIYRSSKAALNAVGKSMAVDLAAEGIISVLLHPGWVQTDMGGRHALITPEVSATGMRSVIAGLKMKDSGKFLNYDGREIPW